MLEISGNLSNGVDDIEHKFYNLLIAIESAEWLEEINMGENECNEAKAFYKEKIIEMVVKCDNERFLKFLYNTILSFKKKWGI